MDMISTIIGASPRDSYPSPAAILLTPIEVLACTRQVAVDSTRTFQSNVVKYTTHASWMHQQLRRKSNRQYLGAIRPREVI